VECFSIDWHSRFLNIKEEIKKMSRDICYCGQMFSLHDNSKCNIDQDIHVVPTIYNREHLENKSCWCSPILSYKDEFTNICVWLHKGYEELEQ
jgi:hypothetical protein